MPLITSKFSKGKRGCRFLFPKPSSAMLSAGSLGSAFVMPSLFLDQTSDDSTNSKLMA